MADLGMKISGLPAAATLGCTSLTMPPALPIGTLARCCCRETFRDTGGTFTGTPAINTTYYTTKPPVPAA